MIDYSFYLIILRHMLHSYFNIDFTQNKQIDSILESSAILKTCTKACKWTTIASIFLSHQLVQGNNIVLISLLSHFRAICKDLIFLDQFSGKPSENPLKMHSLWWITHFFYKNTLIFAEPQYSKTFSNLSLILFLNYSYIMDGTFEHTMLNSS